MISGEDQIKFHFANFDGSVFLVEISLPQVSINQAMNQVDSDSTYEPVEFIQNQSAIPPPSFLTQSRELLSIIESGRGTYIERTGEWLLLCGRSRGNLLLNPCGHNYYCLNCIIQHCSINDSTYPRHCIRCPECKVQIRSVIFAIIRDWNICIKINNLNLYIFI